MDPATARIGQLIVPAQNLDPSVPCYRDLLGLQYQFALMSQTTAGAA
jgi:hypothetical protein